MVDTETFIKSARVVKTAYEEDEGFREATKSSILSAIKDLKGSHGDEEVAKAIADRVFGDN